MVTERICSLCGEECSNEARFKDDHGRYFHQRCYEESPDDVEQLTTSQPAGQRVPTTKRPEAKPGLSLTNRIGWGFFHGLIGGLFMTVVAFHSKGRRGWQLEAKEVEYGLLLWIIALSASFTFLGGFLGGAPGWIRFKQIYRARLSSENNLHRAVTIFAIVFFLVVGFLFYRSTSS